MLDTVEKGRDLIAVPSSYRFGSWPEIVENGGYFFAVDSMRFFGSRVLWGTLTASGSGRYMFVTSEVSPSGVRAYSVREFVPGDGVNTVGEFHAYGDRAAAVRAMFKEWVR